MVDLDYTIGGKKIGGEIASGGGGGGALPDASTIQKGAVLLATQSDAESGTNTTKALSPAAGKVLVEKTLLTALKDASSTQKGIVELSDPAENAAGVSTTTAVSPAGVKEIIWQVSKRGLQPVSDIYVDPVTGVDSATATGAMDQPYKTLDYALKSANPELKTTINLSAGTYGSPAGGFKVDDFVNLTIKPKVGVTTGQAKILVKLGTGTPTVSNGFLIRNCNEVFIKGLEFLCDTDVTASGYATPINTAWESSNGYIEIGDCIFNAVPGAVNTFANSSISAVRSRVTLVGTITIRGSAVHFLFAGLSAYCSNLATIVFENAPVFSGSFIRCEYSSLFRMNKAATGTATGRSFESRFNSRVEAPIAFPATMGAGLNENLMGIARATATLDFPAVAANASASLSMSVAGVAIGDPVALGTPVPPAGITFAATVTAANSVTITAFNRSTASVDIPASSFTVIALK